MFNIDVSVIIPVYNSENYLEKCLNSLLRQTLENIEIICINDGSTDKSLELLNKYAKEDSRIKVISKENGGAASARNRGLDNVNGKYVAFVDADDWIDFDMLEKLYNLSESKKTDIIIFKMLDYDEKNDKFYKSNYYKIKPLKKFNNKLFKTEDIGNKLFKVTTSTANKFYNAEFLKKSEAHFPEGLIFEDNPFFFDLMLKADKVFLLDEYIYYRRRRQSSVMSSINENYFGIIPITNLVIDIFKNNNSLEKYKIGLFNFKIQSIRSRYNIVEYKFKNNFFTMINEDLKVFINKYGENDVNVEEGEYYVYEKFTNNFKDILNETNYNFVLNSLNAGSMEEFNLLNQISSLKKQIKKIEKENNKIKKELSICKNRKIIKIINKFKLLIKK